MVPINDVYQRLPRLSSHNVLHSLHSSHSSRPMSQWADGAEKKLTKRLDNWGGKKRCSVSLPLRARPCFCFSLSLSQQTNLSKLMAFSAVSRATIPSSSLRLPAALPCPSAHPPSVCPPLAPLHFLHGVWSTTSTPTHRPHSLVSVSSLFKHFIVACMDE